MAEPATLAYVAIAAAAAGAATNQYAANKEGRAQRKAAEQQKAIADRQMALESEANAKMNARKADISSLLDGNAISDVGSETNLTGAQGQLIDDSLLGKNNSLGA